MCAASEEEHDEEDEEDEEHAEDLRDEPAVGGDGAQVAQELRVRRLDVHGRLIHVRVDAHDRLLLLGHHRGQLLEDAAQLHDRRLDALHRRRTRRHVRVLQTPSHQLVTHDQGSGIRLFKLSSTILELSRLVLVSQLKSSNILLIMIHSKLCSCYQSCLPCYILSTSDK